MSPLTFVAVAFTLALQAAVPQQAAVSGTVFEAESNMPVAGAQVTLISFSFRPQPGRPPEPLVAATDQNGRYQFDALEPGRYRVSVQKAGFATMLGVGLPEVTLKAGERRTEVHVTIQRGAAVVGRVLDENGEPIANANVMAWRPPPVPDGAAAPARPGLLPAGALAQTNDLGEFRLFGLAPGDVYVQRPRALISAVPLRRAGPSDWRPIFRAPLMSLARCRSRLPRARLRARSRSGWFPRRLFWYPASSPTKAGGPSRTRS